MLVYKTLNFVRIERSLSIHMPFNVESLSKITNLTSLEYLCKMILSLDYHCLPLKIKMRLLVELLKNIQST